MTPPLYTLGQRVRFRVHDAGRVIEGIGVITQVPDQWHRVYHAIARCSKCSHKFTADLPAEAMEPQPVHWELMRRCPDCGAVTAVTVVAQSARTDDIA